MSLIHVFAYGTLKPGEVSYALCADRVIHSRPGFTYGQLYHLPLGYPALVLTGTEPVWGVVLSFDTPEILPILDDYEQHAPDVLKYHLPPGSSLEEYQYQRREIEVVDQETGQTGMAWAYVMPITQVVHLGGVRVSAGNWQGQFYLPDTLT